MSQFWTVLAGDYSGKAEVFAALRRETGWPVISCDDPYVDSHPVVRWLRKFAFFEAYSRVGQPYSAELVFSLLTPIALYLRDEVIRAAVNGPVVVDSYYYTLLAKGIITGIADENKCAAWRALLQPVPQGVIYLDVDPEIAWHRARGVVNPYEYYGAEPTWEGFAKFQQDLRSVLLDQIKDLPAVLIDANRPARRVAADVIAALREIGMPPEKLSSFVA